MANLKLFKKNSKPSNPVVGGVYFITSENKIYLYTNNGWEDYTLTAISGKTSFKGTTSGYLSALDNCYNPQGNGNIFYNLPSSQVTCERSSDSGATWIKYTSSTEEYKLILMQQSFLTIAGTDGKRSNTARVRITIYAGGGQESAEKNIYSSLQKLLVLFGSSSARKSYFQIETKNATNTQTSDWVIQSKTQISGDSGWNAIPLGFVLGGGATQNQPKYIRFTFWSENVDNCYSDPYIVQIKPISTTIWNCFNNMQRYGVPYTTSNNAMVVDMSVTSPQFVGPLNGNATSATISSAVSWEEYS